MYLSFKFFGKVFEFGEPKETQSQKYVRLFMTGFLMGAADIVPGVSGGTVAFLFGIYEELLYSIKLVSSDVLKLFLQRQFSKGFKLIPFSFLVPVGLGVVTAVITLASFITFLLQMYPVYLWSFFFGLVVASIWVVRKRVVTWDLHDFVALTFTSVATYFLVGAVPVETPANLLMYFVSGAIAICAMILPGISGSFLLVIMGKYEQILLAVTQKDLVVLAAVLVGVVVGLAVFSRILSYLFAKHHDIMIALLTGFMVGSLRKIWPWKEVLLSRINSHGDLVPVVERNIFPAAFDMSLIVALLLMIVGFLIIYILDKKQITDDKSSDLPGSSFKKEHSKAVSSQSSHKI